VVLVVVVTAVMDGIGDASQDVASLRGIRIGITEYVFVPIDESLVVPSSGGSFSVPSDEQDILIVRDDNFFVLLLLVLCTIRSSTIPGSVILRSLRMSIKDQRHFGRPIEYCSLTRRSLSK